MNVHEASGNILAPRRQALRIAVVPGALPGDWRGIYERLDRSARGRTGLFLNLAAAAATFGAVVGTGWALAQAIAAILPTTSWYFGCCVAILPALLAGMAAGQFAGNVFLRAALRLDDATRRGFATRLTLARCPDSWPPHLRRWLFTGDWLGTPGYDLRLPYARIYVEGEAPLDCREEDALWREIHRAVSGDSLWEAGANFREISYPGQLPSWAAGVEAGDGFADLRERIGGTEASEWVMHLWRRACRQWPALGANDYPERARRECFEMHAVALHSGSDTVRRALVVVLRPTSFVLELKLEEERDQAA